MRKRRFYQVAMSAVLMLPLAFTSCSSNDEATETKGQPEVLSIDGTCNTYTLENSENASWQIVSCPKWVTPVKDSGSATDPIELYVESNIRMPLRQGDIKIAYSNGVTRSTRAEQTDEQKSWSLSRSCALGWSFDVRTFNDSRGVKGQIFNTAKIKRDEITTNKNFYAEKTETSTNTLFYYGEDASMLSDALSAKADANIKYNMFSLDLQASFGKSALNNSKRIFSWIRGVWGQRELYFNGLDWKTVYRNDWYTTDFAAMRQEVIDSDGSDAAISRLIEQYGTHVVTVAILGGCYDYYFSTVLDEKEDSAGLKAAINFGYAQKFKLKADGAYENKFKTLNNETIEKFSVKGGDAVGLANAVESGTLTQEKTDAWLEDLNKNEKYELIDYTLQSIHLLFPVGTVRTKVQYYIKRMYYSDNPVTRSMK